MNTSNAAGLSEVVARSSGSLAGSSGSYLARVGAEHSIERLRAEIVAIERTFPS
jgi:hypothetical protein